MRVRRGLVAGTAAVLLSTATAAGVGSVPVAVGSPAETAAVPAPAAVDTHHYSSTYPESTSPIKLRSVACPAGKKVYGGGARIGPAGGANGNVMLSTLEPYSNSSGDGFTARGTARRDYSGSWSLTVYAICGNPLPGWELRQNSYTSESSVIVGVVCTAGKKLIGMGGRITDADGMVTFGFIKPEAAYVSVHAKDDWTDNLVAPSVSLRTTAICANQPAGWLIYTYDHPDFGRYSMSHIISCPAGKLLSIGMTKNNYKGDVYLTNMNPANLSTAQIGLRPRARTNPPWTFTSYLICAT